MIAVLSQESLNGSLERFVYTKGVSPSVFDFNVLPVSWRDSTAFQLAPEAVDEYWPNGFLPACGFPPNVPDSVR
jgi:hypothetical protein